MSLESQITSLAQRVGTEIKSVNTPFVGASDSSSGSKGMVPAPEAGDTDKVLAGDGTWKRLSALSGSTSTDDVLPVSPDLTEYFNEVYSSD